MIEDAYDLIEEAEQAAPASEFVQSVRDFYEDRGFITEKQYAALERIVEDRR